MAWPWQMSPRGHRARATTGLPRRPVAVVRRNTALLPSARHLHPAPPRGARAARGPGKAATGPLLAPGPPGFSLRSRFYFFIIIFF